MEKALNVLKELCLVINFNSYWKPRVDEAIARIEESIKPKSCDSCRSKFCSIKRILLERDEINSSYFYCNDYEPKDNA